MGGLYEVREFDIPLTVNHATVVAHARRVAALYRLFMAARPAKTSRYRGAETYGAIVPLCIAMSHVVDLHISPVDGKPVGRIISGQLIRQAVWPASVDAQPMHDVVAMDAPVYEPPNTYGRCPVKGSRGGNCNERGRTGAEWVTDAATGEWERREMCDLHLPIAKERRKAAPTPAPNRGGLLAAAFSELDVTAMYRWAVPGWQPAGTEQAPEAPPMDAVRPTLRLVLGDTAT